MSSHVAEDSFLEKWCSEKSIIRVGFLASSSCLFTEGKIIDYDTDTIILDIANVTCRIPNKHMLIYKHSM